MLLSIQSYGEPTTQSFGDYAHRCIESAIPEDADAVAMVVIRIREGRLPSRKSRCVVEFRFEHGSSLVLRDQGDDMREVLGRIAMRARGDLAEQSSLPRRSNHRPALRRVS